MEPEPLAAIIHPDADCASFTVGGVTYIRTESLALGRAKLLQRFQTELQFDTSIPGVQKSVQAVWDLLNAGRWADGIQEFGRLRDTASLLGTNRFRQAEIVGLFYNAPNEDPTTYEHNAFTDKVYKKWAAVDADFFTQAAFGLLLRTSTRYPLPQSPPLDYPISEA